MSINYDIIIRNKKYYIKENLFNFLSFLKMAQTVLNLASNVILFLLNFIYNSFIINKGEKIWQLY